MAELRDRITLGKQHRVGDRFLEDRCVRGSTAGSARFIDLYNAYTEYLGSDYEPDVTMDRGTFLQFMRSRKHDTFFDNFRWSDGRLSQVRLRKDGE